MTIPTFIFYRYGETVVTTKKIRGSDGVPSALFIHPDWSQWWHHHDQRKCHGWWWHLHRSYHPKETPHDAAHLVYPFFLRVPEIHPTSNFSILGFRNWLITTIPGPATRPSFPFWTSPERSSAAPCLPVAMVYFYYPIPGMCGNGGGVCVYIHTYIHTYMPNPEASRTIHSTCPLSFSIPLLSSCSTSYNCIQKLHEPI